MNSRNEIDPANDEIDLHVRALLSTLDPERTDAGYWHRMHRWVVNSAAPELARRRRAVEATVSEVVISWWRALVPTAAMAGALAAFLLYQPERPTAPVAYVDLDEMLLEGVDAPVMPAFETAGPDGGVVTVSEVF
jgi:hypothetical protein